MGKSILCPGFRFHPTDVELVMYYLKKKLLGKKLIPEVIAEVNIYDFSPWDLPAQSKLRNGDLEWFFFCSKSKKYSSGSRTNRATEAGYWKATGKDKEVKYQNRTVAKRKTLVFHLDHPPNGKRTDWVMHEYRMEDKDLDPGVVQGAYVICRVFKKSGAGPQNGAQYGAPFEEEDWDADEVDCSEPSAAVGQSGVTETWNLNASSSAVTNMISTEPGPSTVTCENHNKTSTVTCLALVGLSGDTRAPNPRPSSSYVMNMKSTEPGPSTMPTNEEIVSIYHDDDSQACNEEIVSIYHEFERKQFSCDGFTSEEIVSIYHDDDTQEQEQEQKVEDGKGMEEDDSFFEGLDGLGLGDLDPLSNIDESADFTLDTSLPADDIDAELCKFFRG